MRRHTTSVAPGCNQSVSNVVDVSRRRLSKLSKLSLTIGMAAIDKNRIRNCGGAVRCSSQIARHLSVGGSVKYSLPSCQRPLRTPARLFWARHRAQASSRGGREDCDRLQDAICPQWHPGRPAPSALPPLHTAIRDAAPYTARSEESATLPEANA